MLLLKSEDSLSFKDLGDHELFTSLEDLIDRSILIFPFSNKKIIFSKTNKLVTKDNIKINCVNECPILIPEKLPKNILDYKLSNIVKFSNPFFQYQILSLIKGNGEIIGVNADTNSLSYRKHLFRIKNFLKCAKGNFLDIGCDDVSISSKIMPKECEYLGIDPFIKNSSEFKVFGMGEALPFTNNSFDNVLFNASLDHILDYYEAISEAYRVLKKKGSLYLSSYVWKEKATLLTDIVHFHHFRENQLISCIEELFQIKNILRYESPKNDYHRYQIFVRAERK